VRYRIVTRSIVRVGQLVRLVVPVVVLAYAMSLLVDVESGEIRFELNEPEPAPASRGELPPEVAVFHPENGFLARLLDD
jgi:hypothetical protein